MARRHLTFTLDFTLDEDECRRFDEPMKMAAGDSRYTETIDLLRTALHHQAAMILGPFDPHLSPPEVTGGGVTYETPDPLDNAF